MPPFPGQQPKMHHRMSQWPTPPQLSDISHYVLAARTPDFKLILYSNHNSPWLNNRLCPLFVREKVCFLQGSLRIAPSLLPIFAFVLYHAWLPHLSRPLNEGPPWPSMWPWAVTPSGWRWRCAESSSEGPARGRTPSASLLTPLAPATWRTAASSPVSTHSR